MNRWNSINFSILHVYIRVAIDILDLTHQTRLEPLKSQLMDSLKSICSTVFDWRTILINIHHCKSEIPHIDRILQSSNCLVVSGYFNQWECSISCKIIVESRLTLMIKRDIFQVLCNKYKSTILNLKSAKTTLQVEHVAYL